MDELNPALEIETGSLITVTFEEREFSAIVIDPNGLAPGEPSVGFGFRMAQKHIGISQQTLSARVTSIEGEKVLKAPSGNAYRVTSITGQDNNDYLVIEVSDWFDLCLDLLINPGRLPKSSQSRIGEFLRWFAVKGFYAEANVALKGVYTAKSSRATTQWLITRQSGKPVRNSYTDLISESGAHVSAYGKYTNRVYEGLFGIPAAEMREVWATVSGSAKIARNHIGEEEGLQAVKYCEDLVVRIYAGDLDEAHADAIRLTVRKFKLHPEFHSGR
jgi:hypothetical protein